VVKYKSADMYVGRPKYTKYTSDLHIRMRSKCINSTSGRKFVTGNEFSDLDHAECYKDDVESPWENVKFDHPASENA